MAKGQTRKSCHGCGKEGWRPSDGLCVQCRKELREARAIVAAAQANPDLVEYRMPWTYYSLPYISHQRQNCIYGEEREFEKEFRTAIRDLIRLIAIPKREGHVWSENLGHVIEGTSDTEGTIYLNPTARELLNTIFQTTLEMVDLAHANGKAEGSSFVTRLATGEISIDQFNKAATAGK